MPKTHDGRQPKDMTPDELLTVVEAQELVITKAEKKIGALTISTFLLESNRDLIADAYEALVKEKDQPAVNEEKLRESIATSAKLRDLLDSKSRQANRLAVAVEDFIALWCITPLTELCEADIKNVRGALADYRKETSECQNS